VAARPSTERERASGTLVTCTGAAAEWSTKALENHRAACVDVPYSIEGVLAQLPRKERKIRSNGYESVDLDPIDLRLLGELQADGRLGMAELGRRVGMSAPAIAERVQRLERAGVIAGYHAELDPRRFGFPVGAIVRIRPAPGQLARIPEIARESPEVAECHRITGEDCYLARLNLRSIDDLEEVLDRFTPYGLTTTSIIHSTPVPRRGPPLDDASADR
jgi:Lrp/AsnC family leucine-responsive transcriptional regulator